MSLVSECVVMCTCSLLMHVLVVAGLGQSFMSVVLNIPHMLSLSEYDALAESNIHKHIAETRSANLSYVENACVSDLLHICWNESSFPVVGVPKVEYRLDSDLQCEGG